MNANVETLHARMREALEPVPAGASKSERIRCLARAGFERGDIARFFGIRYQFVYNVVAAAGIEATPAGPERGTPDRGLSEAGTANATLSGGTTVGPSDRWSWTTIAGDGSVRLPDAFREALGLSAGDPVQIECEGDALVLRSRAVAIDRLQTMLAEAVPDGRSLSDELIAERRAEARVERGR